MKQGLIKVGLVLAAVIGISEIQPTQEALDLANSPASVCPSGWADQSSTIEHAIDYLCVKDGWNVRLKPDLSFDYAWEGVVPIAHVYDASQVPNWPTE